MVTAKKLIYAVTWLGLVLWILGCGESPAPGDGKAAGSAIADKESPANPTLGPIEFQPHELAAYDGPIVGPGRITVEDIELLMNDPKRRKLNRTTGLRAARQHAICEAINLRMAAEEARREGRRQDPEYQRDRKLIEDYVLKWVLFQVLIKDAVSVTEEDVRKYIEENPEEYQRDHATCRYRTIMFNLREESPEEQKVKRQDAQKAWQELEKGRDFVEVAFEYSEETDKTRRGQLTPRQAVHRIRNKDVREAVEAAGTGHYTKPIEHDQRIEIVYVHDLRPPGPLPEEEIMGPASKAALLKARENMAADYMTRLRNDYELEMHSELLERENLASGTVLAKSTIFTITYEDLAHYIRQHEDELGRYPWKYVLEEIMVVSRLMGPDGDRVNVTERPEYRARINWWEERYLGQPKFDEILENGIEYTEEDLREFYRQNQKLYMTGKRLHLSKIAIPPRFEDIEANGKKEALKRARKLADEIRDRATKGEDFAALAKEYSADPSAADSGDVGWQDTGRMPFPMRLIFNGLKPGQISPIQLRRGNYEFNKVIEVKPSEPIPFEEVRDSVKRRFLEPRREDIRDEVIALRLQPITIMYNDAVMDREIDVED